MRFPEVLRTDEMLKEKDVRRREIVLLAELSQRFNGTNFSGFGSSLLELASLVFGHSISY